MPHPATPARHVFVYGTLRKGGRNDIARFAPAPVFVADAVIAGTLHDLGSYPGAVLGGAGRVIGEIYAITPAVEAELDRLEEVAPDESGEYIKREIGVVVGAHVFACLIYEIHPQRIVGKPVIASGDWFDRMPRGS